MAEGPSIVRIAAAIADHARAEVLATLLSGRALTASELAAIAGVTKQTISAHLAKLVEVRLLSVEKQGRHRYFRLANRQVARLLESLMGVASVSGAMRLRAGPREPALRRARVCYDHLAGEIGVLIYEELVRQERLADEGGAVRVTAAGHEWFAHLGIDVASMAAGRRRLCRPCLDWSERRRHLAGALGAALFERIERLGWAKRVSGSRAIAFTAAGERALHAALGA
jgi:DNA-binding transcriptional ArsR family regulator